MGEFVGFFITIVIVAFSIWRQSEAAKKRKADPKAYAKEQRQQSNALKEFLGALDIDNPDEEEEAEALPLPLPSSRTEVAAPEKPQPPPVDSGTHRLVREVATFRSKIEDRKSITNLDKRKLVSQLDNLDKDRLVSLDIKDSSQQVAYAFKVRDRSSRASRLVDDLDDRREMLLYAEIFGPPKSLQ